MGFLSKKANCRGVVMQEAVVLGPSTVGPGSFVDSVTIVGYPQRGKILTLVESLKNQLVSFEILDDLSSGSIVGSGCIVRSGCIIYEEAIVSDEVELGHGVLVRAGSKIGERTKIGSHSQLDGAVEVGQGVVIQSQVYLPHLTKVGDNVFMGPAVKVTNDRYPPSRKLVSTVIEDNVVIGSGALLLPGVRIGEGAVVAAGAVVTRDVAPGVVVAGIPARKVYTREEYEKRKQTYENNSDRGIKFKSRQ